MLSEVSISGVQSFAPIQDGRLPQRRGSPKPPALAAGRGGPGRRAEYAKI